MTEQQIRDEAITLFNAGHDSTAAALSWAWYLLLKDSQAYEQLIKQSAEESQPAIALQIAKEALRLYPPAWVLPRQALEDTEIAGYSIPKKSLINVFPYVIHRDERFFPSPASFKPERFEEKNEQKIYPFAYFPFGAGPRICIGKDMALKEMQIVLSAISKKFRLEAAPDQQLIEPVPLISLEQKVGVKAIVRAL